MRCHMQNGGCRRSRFPLLLCPRLRHQLRPRVRRLPARLAVAASIALTTGAGWWWGASRARSGGASASHRRSGHPRNALGLMWHGVRCASASDSAELCPHQSRSYGSPDRPAAIHLESTGRSHSVAVFAPGFHKAAESAWLGSVQWTPSAPPERGRTYAWQVTARMGLGEDAPTVRAPALTDPEARFRVVDAAEATELARAAREPQRPSLIGNSLRPRRGFSTRPSRSLAHT
jgi:hypothetical protein